MTEHSVTRMVLTNRERRPFKNHLVHKSYWINCYACPACGKTRRALSNMVKGAFNCNGIKITTSAR